MTVTGYIKPPWLARVVGSRMARLFKRDVVSLLSVPGRRSGRWHDTAVAVLTYNHQRYLLSAYGDTEWSRNLREAGTGRLTRRGRTEEFTAEVLSPEHVPPLVEEYLRQFGRLPNVAKTFAALPNFTDHPAFRITSERQVPSQRNDVA